MTTFKEVADDLPYVAFSFHVDVDKEAWEIVDDIMEALMEMNPFAAPEVLASAAEHAALSVL